MTWSALQVVQYKHISQKENKLTINEVSKKFSISQDTLRYYEKIGLLDNIPRKNGIRDYDEQAIKQIEFVKCMRGAGVSTKTLTLYMQLLRIGESTTQQRKDLLCAERDKIKQKLDDIRLAYDRLNYKIERYDQILSKPNF